uniref:Tektin n=1 Tax=Scleropages formosus TaxID=113540 RepID=A0A8C9R3N8_SCLFO
MAASPMKERKRCSVADWESSNRQLWESAELRRLTAHRIRQEARHLRNDTLSKMELDQSNSFQHLSDRIQEVSRWKDRLQSCVQEVNKEIDALRKVKEEAEHVLAALLPPLEVSVECLSLREGRRGGELVCDPVEAELKKEVEASERAKRELQQHVDKAFQQLFLLQEARQQLTYDLQNKMEALDVDMRCQSLTVTSPGISLKLSPLCVPLGSTSPQEWEQFSRYNISRAQEETQTSQQLREDVTLTLAKVQSELQAQHAATNFALRKRYHKVDQACSELHWQQKTTREEVAELELDICRLEEDLQAKEAPLKLVHTRLENRATRPGVDLCQDQVQHGLMSELLTHDNILTARLNIRVPPCYLFAHNLHLRFFISLTDISLDAVSTKFYCWSAWHHRNSSEMV